MRGVTFQPIQDAGPQRELRQEARPHVLLSDIRKAIIAAGTAFGAGDIIPLPCNPESIAIGYALRNGRNITPITSFFPQGRTDRGACPTRSPSRNIRTCIGKCSSSSRCATTQCNTPERLEALLCCLPEVPVPQGLGYENVFRLAIVEFLDAHNFCLGRVKRSCIHFLTPNGQIIPFDTYNLFYRNGRIDGIRRRLRQQSIAASADA